MPIDYLIVDMAGKEQLAEILSIVISILKTIRY